MIIIEQTPTTQFLDSVRFEDIQVLDRRRQMHRMTFGGRKCRSYRFSFAWRDDRGRNEGDADRPNRSSGSVLDNDTQAPRPIAYVDFPT
jgi:hypothetical protein